MMDDPRFDAWTKRLADGTSRRTLLRQIGGGTLAGALSLLGWQGAGAQGHNHQAKVRICHVTGSAANPYAVIEVAAAAVPVHAAHGDLVGDESCAEQEFLDLETCTCECVAGTERCNGVCADLATDPEHCGACNNACPAGGECCNGVCHDVQSDPLNCGACGRRCYLNETCEGGSCLCLQSGFNGPGLAPCAPRHVCCPEGGEPPLSSIAGCMCHTTRFITVDSTGFCNLDDVCPEGTTECVGLDDRGCQPTRSCCPAGTSCDENHGTCIQGG